MRNLMRNPKHLLEINVPPKKKNPRKSETGS